MRYSWEEDVALRRALDYRKCFRTAILHGHFHFCRDFYERFGRDFHLDLEEMMGPQFVRGNLEIVDYLLEHGVRFSLDSAVKSAALFSNIDYLSFLVERNLNGFTPKHFCEALRFGNEDVFNFMLIWSNGTLPQHEPVIYFTHAVEGGNVPLFRKLQNIYPRSYLGGALVLAAVRSRSLEMVKALADEYRWFFAEKEILLAIDLGLFDIFCLLCQAYPNTLRRRSERIWIRCIKSGDIQFCQKMLSFTEYCPKRAFLIAALEGNAKITAWLQSISSGTLCK